MRSLLALLFLPSSVFFAQTGSLISEDFTNYNGTSATTPFGWYFNSHGNYTSTTYTGATGPNAYRFGINQAEIISPAFSNADSVRFWIKGAGTDSLSYLLVEETTDSITWTIIDTIKPVPLSATVVHFPVAPQSIHLKFRYYKSVGNLSFDDLEIFSTPDNPSGRITVYFNTPVDTTVGFPPHAKYLSQSLDDTLIAYIDRSQYTLDIAVYNFNQSGNISSIANAVNNAFARGVQIRWIYNGSSTNAGISLLNPSIQTLVSPTTSTYGLMHNKFMIVDAASLDPARTFVWTGSMNWEEGQVNTDHNNVVIIQDQQLAKAYTREFNQMWGGAGPVPNITLSRFGPTKFENNIHRFIIGGRAVDLYFSPAQNTGAHIVSSINSSNSDLYFGVYAFTQGVIALPIKQRIQSGVYAAGIMDQFSVPYAADDTLMPMMGSMLRFYNQSTLYHHKFLIVDFSDTTSDPLVLTGSHNWTNAADTKNDENTLIIHDPFVVSNFYEAFYSDFISLGGQLGTAEEPLSSVKLFPNPASDFIRIVGIKGGDGSLRILDALGREVSLIDRYETGDKVDVSFIPPGWYLVRLATSEGVWSVPLCIHR